MLFLVFKEILTKVILYTVGATFLTYKKGGCLPISLLHQSFHSKFSYSRTWCLFPSCVITNGLYINS
jgi:hypothetical protein